MCYIYLTMKTEILHILEAKRGKFISGETLASDFNVSRAAVWKAIASLRKEGHKIIALPHKGYSLAKFSDILTQKGILANLKEGSKISKVLCFGKIDSTNTYAKFLVQSGISHGTLIASNQQTAGRGRHGHSFISPPGTGLYMTLILRPSVEAAKFQMITIAAAVAVCLAIEELDETLKGQLKIKWVNDIFLNGRKISGILTEAISSFESGEIECVITGIGINVTTRNFDAELSQTAGAIFPDDNITFGRDELCARIADYIMDFSENLTDPAIIPAYRERSMLTGQNIIYMKDGREHYAHVEGIDDSGGLVVSNGDGKIETLRSGEVFMVRQKG